MRSTKEKCRTLRNKGFTLGEIIKITKLPKTTIYYHIKYIPLPAEVKERIKEENTRRINEFNIKVRKGKCVSGRIIIKPEGWIKGLIFLTAHFMFDGEVTSHSCIYHNRNEALIHRVRKLMIKIFNLRPRYYFNKETGVRRISYNYVELADYMRKKSRELKKYIKTSPLTGKRIFLRAFFDDEGNVHKYKNVRTIRGFQNNLEILKLI